MVLLTTNPTIQKSIELVLKKAKLTDDDRQLIQKYKDSEELPLDVLELVLKHSRKISGNDGPWLHELVAESEIVIAKIEPKKKSPELVQRLKELQEKLDNREYAKMVSDVTQAERLEKEREEDRQVLAHSGEGLGIIVTMFTGFMLCFVLAKQATDSPIVHLSAGLGGMIAMLLIQGWLFVIKSHRGILGTEKRNKKSQSIFGQNKGNSTKAFQLPKNDASVENKTKED